MYLPLLSQGTQGARLSFFLLTPTLPHLAVPRDAQVVAAPAEVLAHARDEPNPAEVVRARAVPLGRVVRIPRLQPRQEGVAVCAPLAATGCGKVAA